MNISAADGSFVTVLIMAIVTLATRFGGVYVMSYMPISKRVQRFIRAMSSSVLIALLAPMTVAGDTGVRSAMLTTALMMLLLKRPLPAIACGIFVAALSRHL